MTPMEAYGKFMKELTEVSVSHQVQEGMMLFAMVVAYRAFIGAQHPVPEFAHAQQGSLDEQKKDAKQDEEQGESASAFREEEIVRPNSDGSGGGDGPMSLSRALSILQRDLPESLKYEDGNGLSVMLRRRISEDPAAGMITVDYFPDRSVDPIRLVIDPSVDRIDPQQICNQVLEAAKARIILSRDGNSVRYIHSIPPSMPVGAVTDEVV